VQSRLETKWKIRRSVLPLSGKRVNPDFLLRLSRILAVYSFGQIPLALEWYCAIVEGTCAHENRDGASNAQGISG
jgi:hypothetical protein